MPPKPVLSESRPAPTLKKFVEKPFETCSNIKKSILGIGVIGYNGPNASLLPTCPPEELREKIQLPSGEALDYSEPVTALFQNTFDIFKRNKKETATANFGINRFEQTFLNLHKRADILLEEILKTELICFRNSRRIVISKKLNILKTKLETIQNSFSNIDPARISRQSRKLFHDLEHILLELGKIRFEISIVQILNEGTSDYQILRIFQRDEEPIFESQNIQPIRSNQLNWLSPNEEKDFFMLFEDQWRAILSNYFLDERVSGSFFQFSPFFVPIDYSKCEEESLTPVELILTYFDVLVLPTSEQMAQLLENFSSNVQEAASVDQAFQRLEIDYDLDTESDDQKKLSEQDPSVHLTLPGSPPRAPLLTAAACSPIKSPPHKREKSSLNLQSARETRLLAYRERRQALLALPAPIPARGIPVVPIPAEVIPAAAIPAAAIQAPSIPGDPATAVGNLPRRKTPRS